MIRNRTGSIALLCLVFTMILAACGGAPAATPTTAPAAAAPTAAAPAAAEPTAAPAAAEATAAPAAAEPTTAPAAVEPVAGATLNGVTLPDDAAPADQQVYVVHFDNTADFTTIDFFESVYKRGGAITDILSDPLVRLDKNFKTVPGAATKWEVDSTGLVWSFHLDPSLVWTDDTPVTADDYVATFQYAADPKHAWDFTWFFQGTIKNWTDVVAGKTPVDQLGVKAADANTFQVTTEAPAPYLPAMMLYSNA